MKKVTKQLTVKEEVNDFLFYTTPNGDVRVEVLFNDEQIWATQDTIAEIFGVQRPAVTKHLKNIFLDEELKEKSVSSILERTANDNKRYKYKFYNLDAIISVGYRVNSRKATQFRIWATNILKGYIQKGFALDDRRLKNGQFFGKDYFRELLERIRSIRTSERRIWLQITDIFQECSIDYDPKSQITKNFFATIQNKFHYAITGQTAAEIVHANADRNKPNMGLMTWKNAAQGRILKSDVKVAKNYLSEEEIKELEGSISNFFDYIERIIKNRNTFTMELFAKSINKFLKFNEFKILEGKGHISAKQAEKKAFIEYDEFNKTQKIESDFEKLMIKTIKIQRWQTQGHNFKL